MAAKFQIYQDAKGESYPTAAGAHAGVPTVKRAAAATTIVQG